MAGGTAVAPNVTQNLVNARLRFCRLTFAGLPAPQQAGDAVKTDPSKTIIAQALRQPCRAIRTA